MWMIGSCRPVYGRPSKAALIMQKFFFDMKDCVPLRDRVGIWARDYREFVHREGRLPQRRAFARDAEQDAPRVASAGPKVATGEAVVEFPR
jgi:hypothetical protein